MQHKTSVFKRYSSLNQGGFAPLPPPFALPVLAGGVCLAGMLWSSVARAGDWGLSIAYNNPAGANVGGNLIYIGDTLGFEVGVGSVGGASGENSASGALGGDIDLKFFFDGKVRPYLEAGLGMAIGAGLGEGGGFGASAGSPFVGAGLLFEASKVFLYGAADYKINTKKLYPAVGVGVKF